MTAWHPRASVTPRILLLSDSPADADAVVAAFARAGHAASCLRVATRRGLTETLREGACDAVVVDCGLRRLEASSSSPTETVTVPPPRSGAR